MLGHGRSGSKRVEAQETEPIVYHHKKKKKERKEILISISRCVKRYINTVYLNFCSFKLSFVPIIHFIIIDIFDFRFFPYFIFNSFTFRIFHSIYFNYQFIYFKYRVFSRVSNR